MILLRKWEKLDWKGHEMSILLMLRKMHSRSALLLRQGR